MTSADDVTTFRDHIVWYFQAGCLVLASCRILLFCIPGLVLGTVKRDDLMPFLRVHRRRDYIRLRAINIEMCSMYD